MLDPRPEIRIATRFLLTAPACLRRSPARRLASVSVPMIGGCFALLVRCATSRSASLGGDDREHADAAVEGAQHFALGYAADAWPASRRPSARRRRRGRCAAARCSGRTRGMLSMKPPPVMWARALMPMPALQRREQRLHVDAGRRRAAPRPACCPSSNGAGQVPGEAGDLDDLADQRIAVGVHARRGDGDEHVAGGDVGARQQRAALGGADRKAREIVVVAVIHARHLGGLAADQRAAGDRGSPRRCRRRSRSPAATSSLPVAK